MQSRCYKQALTVPFEYDVWFARRVWDVGHPLIAEVLLRADDPRPVMAVAFVDDGVARGHSDLLVKIEQYFSAHVDALCLCVSPQIVPGGEQIKNDLLYVQEAIELFERAQLCRHAFVLAIGGGAVLDTIGFAAALYHRGLRLVRFPTTVLSQNDVGVGVKNAINYPAGKNTIGTFSPPWSVINDFHFLSTLPDEHWIAGVAEAFKVAMIRDAEFFCFLCDNALRLRNREATPMEHLILRCAELHLEHIRASGDPFEFGQARPLDFGHWAAHALEVMSDYRVGHGEAVAVGLALDSLYAVKQGWLPPQAFDALCDGLRASGFRLWRPELEQRDARGRLRLLDGLESFRRHLGGRLYLTFPLGIGRRHEVTQVDERLLEACALELRQWNDSRC